MVDETSKTRGRVRSITTPHEMYISTRRLYLKRLENPIIFDDIVQYFAIVISMGIRKYASIDSYFQFSSLHLGMIFLIF